MAKVLISFLGLGALNRQNESDREYRTATYEINDKKVESSFVTSVLSRELQCDKIILIGTMKSMWEEVYRYFSQENGTWHEPTFWQIADIAANANHQSEIDYTILGKVATTIGEKSNIILIKYGLNQEELQYNFKVIAGIEQFLDENDELHIDITHSFRSLSVFIMTTLFYLRDVSEKKLKVGGLYYGMLDIIRELGHAPIVNLKYLTDTIDWIKGAHAFQSFGNGELIANLLQEKQQNDLAKKVKKISNAFGINYASSIKNQLEKLNRMELNLNVPESLIVPKVIENFKKQFEGYTTEAQFQIELAEWYNDNHLYASAYILLAESLVTFVCEEEGYTDASDRDKRKTAKGLLFNNVRYNSINQNNWYKTIQDIRNDIAHASIGNRTSMNNDIIQLKNRIQKAKKIIYKK